MAPGKEEQSGPDDDPTWKDLSLEWEVDLRSASGTCGVRKSMDSHSPQRGSGMMLQTTPGHWLHWGI